MSSAIIIIILSTSEIEFKLHFGCDRPTYIDQGIRFEVNVEDWNSIRFYTPALTVPTNSLVQLDATDSSVIAQARRYNSSLPLLFVNSTEPITVREYLCGRYVSLLREGTRLRLRWMQRYRTNIAVDVATWFLDDINIRLWNGECFTSIFSDNFDNATDTSVRRGNEMRMRMASFSKPICEEDDGFVLYFHRRPNNSMATVSRRSLTIGLQNITLGSCENPDDTAGECGAVICGCSDV